jgi:hypothetical protein
MNSLRPEMDRSEKKPSIIVTIVHALFVVQDHHLALSIALLEKISTVLGSSQQIARARVIILNSAPAEKSVLVLGCAP